MTAFIPAASILTGRLIDSLQIESDESVLDVACGIGTTSLMVGQRHNASVTGIDFSEVNVQRANEAASASAPNTTVKFKTGDATDLPVLNLTVVFGAEAEAASFARCTLTSLKSMPVTLALCRWPTISDITPA